MLFVDLENGYNDLFKGKEKLSLLQYFNVGRSTVFL